MRGEGVRMCFVVQCFFLGTEKASEFRDQVGRNSISGRRKQGDGTDRRETTGLWPGVEG